MKLSELVREYIDLKIQGEPKSSEWSSISANHQRQQEYSDKLESLEADIDSAITSITGAA